MELSIGNLIHDAKTAWELLFFKGGSTGMEVAGTFAPVWMMIQSYSRRYCLCKVPSKNAAHRMVRYE